MEIGLIFACLPLYVINSFCDKYVSQKNGSKLNIFYNTLKFLICAFILLPLFLTDTRPRFEFGAIFCGTLCGIMYVINKTLMLKGLEICSISFMTLCHSAGMLIPCIAGHLFWGEKIGALSLIGILLAVISIFLIKDAPKDEKKSKWISLVFGLIILFTSGGVMIAQKLMGKYYVGESVSAYNFYSFIVAFLILLFFNRRKPQKDEILKTSLPCSLGSAISLCVISLVMTSISATVPSVIMFPLFNGLGIILVSVLSIFVFKEKFTTKKVVGLILGLIGLCLVNF